MLPPIQAHDDEEEEEGDDVRASLIHNDGTTYGSVEMEENEEQGNGSDQAFAAAATDNNNCSSQSLSSTNLLARAASAPVPRTPYNTTATTEQADTASYSAYSMSSHNPYHPENENSSVQVDQDADGRLLTLTFRIPTLRRVALQLSLYVNLLITAAKLVAYIQTWSLSVLAALLDSVLDVVSQVVLNYTEKHSSLQRSSAFYPAGASRLEPVGVLTCAALMGMASFEVLKESFTTLFYGPQHEHAMGGSTTDSDESTPTNLASFWAMVAIVIVKFLLLWLCNKAANKRVVQASSSSSVSVSVLAEDTQEEKESSNHHNNLTMTRAVVQLADPTLEALAQDHWNDGLSNTVAAVALLCALQSPSLWFLDPVGAILISIYIIYSWYVTGKEQIEQLTGKAAPEDLIEELMQVASDFDARMQVDCIRAYHFGPKFLVEIEMVMPKTTLLFESHDLGMELQYEIEGREEIERCFVHIDYETRPYDEHVVSKVPELREKYRPGKEILFRSAQSV